MIRRPDPTIEQELAEFIHTDLRAYRCYVWAIDQNGVLMSQINTMYLADTDRLAGDVHGMVERFTTAGHDADVAGLVFGWRHDASSSEPAVSIVVVGRDGSVAERQWMTNPTGGVSARWGWGPALNSTVWCHFSAAATTTAFRFATIGADDTQAGGE